MEDLAIVTGSASGIGRACVRRLTKQGIPVVGIDLADGDATDLLARVKEAGDFMIPGHDPLLLDKYANGVI